MPDIKLKDAAAKPSSYFNPLKGANYQQLVMLLTQDTKKNNWEKNKAYIVNEKIYTLDYDIIKRKGKDGVDRYEVISDKKLGEGGFGAVYEVLKTLKISDEGLIFSDKGRVLKKSKNLGKKDQNSAEQEIGMMQKVKHFHVKELIVAENKANIVMAKIPGETLDKLLNKLKNGHFLWKEKDYLEFSILLLKAYKAQVLDKGLLHRDIKPNNIMVDLGPPMQINFIDFGLSAELNKLDEEKHTRAGSSRYMASEMFQVPIYYSTKTDVYALGVVLEQVWSHLDFSGLCFRKNLQTRSDVKNRGTNGASNQIGEEQALANSVKARFKPKHEEQAKRVSACLLGMLKHSCNDRFEFEYALESFSKISQDLGYTSTEVKAVSPVAKQKLMFKFKLADETVKARVEEINNNLQLLGSIERTLRQEGKLKVADTIETLVKDLGSELLKLNIDNLGQKPWLVKRVLKSCEDKISQVAKASTLQEASMQAEEIRCILINLGLAIAGLGLGYLIAIGCNKLITGSFLFFNPPPQAVLITEKLQQDASKSMDVHIEEIPQLA